MQKPIDDERGSLSVSRRESLGMLLMAAASAGTPAAALAGTPTWAEAQRKAPSPPSRGPRNKPYLGIVSRHLQWTDAENAIAVAKKAGFPAIIWTVRPGAHIEPEQVETELPRIVGLTKAAGMETPMVITNIREVTSDRAAKILATLQRLGIRRYRATPPRYNYHAPLPPQYAAFKKELAALGRLNEKYDTVVAFHTQSYANTIGGSAWDLWMLMTDMDPRYVGVNYDIGHVTAKGGAGWRESIRAMGPYLHSVSVKDFYWEKESNVPAGQWPWRTRFVRPGDGMVNFPCFFRYLQSIGFRGPVETYFEYTVNVSGLDKPVSLLGTHYKEWELPMPQKTFIGYLNRDVDFYNNVWHETMTTPPPPPFWVKATI